MTHKQGERDDYYWAAYEWGHNHLRLTGNRLNRFATDFADANTAGRARHVRLNLNDFYRDWNGR